MAVNKYLIVLLVLAVAWIVLAPMAGLSGANTVMTLMFSIGVLFLVSLFTKATRVGPLAKLKPLWLLVIGVILVGIPAGWFSSLGFGPTMFAAPTAPSAPSAPTVPSQPATTTPTGEFCVAGIDYPADSKGDAATVDVYCYDKENNDPFTEVECLVRFYKNGNKIPAPSSTIGGSFNAAVGDVIEWYGGNSTYYVDNGKFCVNSERPSLSIDGHSVAAVSNLQITCYDNTGASELSAGTTSGEEDYDITLGANEETSFFCKLKVNTADKSYYITSIAVGAYNDIDDVRLVAFDKAVGWTPTEAQKSFSVGYLPKFLSHASISNETGGSTTNVTGYDRVYVLDEPILLHEWDEVQFEFTIEAGSTDPANNADFGKSDMAIICFLDSVWKRGTDGKEYFTYYLSLIHI